MIPLVPCQKPKMHLFKRFAFDLNSATCVCQHFLNLTNISFLLHVSSIYSKNYLSNRPLHNNILKGKKLPKNLIFWPCHPNALGLLKTCKQMAAHSIKNVKKCHNVSWNLINFSKLLELESIDLCSLMLVCSSYAYLKIEDVKACRNYAKWLNLIVPKRSWHFTTKAFKIKEVTTIIVSAWA